MIRAFREFFIVRSFLVVSQNGFLRSVVIVRQNYSSRLNVAASILHVDVRGDLSAGNGEQDEIRQRALVVRADEFKSVTVVAVADFVVGNCRVVADCEGVDFNRREVRVFARDCHRVVNRCDFVARLELNHFTIAHAVAVETFSRAEDVIFFVGINVSDLKVAFDAVEFNRD